MNFNENADKEVGLFVVCLVVRRFCWVFVVGCCSMRAGGGLRKKKLMMSSGIRMSRQLEDCKSFQLSKDNT